MISYFDWGPVESELKQQSGSAEEQSLTGQPSVVHFPERARGQQVSRYRPSILFRVP